jgi:DNA-binding XRE family transcriptional regulator
VRVSIDRTCTRPGIGGRTAYSYDQRQINFYENEKTMARDANLNSHVQETLSRQVKAFRAEAGMTQQALAEGCGIYRTYLSRIESGDANPSIGVLIALANTLNIELYKFFIE